MNEKVADWVTRHFPLIVIGLWIAFASLVSLTIWFAVWCFNRGEKAAENRQLIKEITEASENEQNRKN